MMAVGHKHADAGQQNAPSELTDGALVDRDS